MECEEWESCREIGGFSPITYNYLDNHQMKSLNYTTTTTRWANKVSLTHFQCSVRMISHHKRRKCAIGENNKKNKFFARAREGNFSTVGSFFTSRWQTFMFFFSAHSFLSLTHWLYSLSTSTVCCCREMSTRWGENANERERKKNLFARRPQDRPKITKKKWEKNKMWFKWAMPKWALDVFFPPQFISFVSFALFSLFYFLFRWVRVPEREPRNDDDDGHSVSERATLAFNMNFLYIFITLRPATFTKNKRLSLLCTVSVCVCAWFFEEED